MLGDLAAVEELAQAMSDAGAEATTAMSAARGAMAVFSGYELQGQTVDRIRGSWQQLDTVGAKLGTEMQSAANAISLYAQALADVQDDLVQAAAVARQWNLDTDSGGKASLPPHAASYPPDHVQKMHAAMTSANGLVDKAQSRMAAAAKQLIAALNAARAALGDHRILAYDGDFDGALGDIAHGLYTAPEQRFKVLQTAADDADGKASKWGRLLRGGDEAERSQAGRELPAAGRAARAADGALKDAPGWLASIPGARWLSTDLGDFKSLKFLKFGEDIPVAGLVIAGIGTAIDYRQTNSRGGHDSLAEAAAINFSGAAAGIAVGVAIGTGSVGAIAAGVVVGGVIAYGVGDFVGHVWDDHGNVGEAAGQTWHDVDNSGRRLVHDVKSLF